MDRETALSSLGNARRNITLLRQELRAFSPEHTRWIMNTKSLLAEVFGESSQIYVSFSTLPWRFQGSLIATAMTWEYEKAQKDLEVYMASLDIAEGILDSASDHVSWNGIGNVSG